MSRISRAALLWRTTAFRLAIAFAAIFGLAAAAILLVLDLTMARYAEGELRNALRHQMAIMRADAQIEGGAALANILAQHVRSDTIHRYRYLVIPPTGPAFNSGLPESAIQIDGFGKAGALPRDVALGLSRDHVEMLVLAERMPDGTFLAVGRESYPLDDLRAGLHKIALWGGIAIILATLLASAVAGFLFLRRLQLVNETTSRIIEGNLSERIPPVRFGHEFDDLIGNMNTMLERVETTMTTMRQVSTDVAHDLRMPLTRLRNQLEAVRPASLEQASQIESAIEEADQILSIFNAMLRLARIEAGSIPHDMVLLDLGPLIARVVDAYQPAAEEGGHILTGKGADPLPVVGDASLLSQMLANLIDNALVHTPSGTCVEVRAELRNDVVSLSVRDTGPGVPEANIAKLTQRFYRVDHSRGRSGTGLGLSLVAAIVERSRGTMRIANGNPGLCVEISLPRSQPLL